jgi:hypothetical protein
LATSIAAIISCSQLASISSCGTSAPQLQLSAGPTRFFFEAHPNSLKFLDQFLVHQTGESEGRAFIFYVHRAPLVEHLL